MTDPHLSTSAIEVMAQMFCLGPVWDGNLASKDGRNELKTAGLADKVEGFNYLTPRGTAFAVHIPTSRIDLGDRALQVRFIAKRFEAGVRA